MSHQEVGVTITCGKAKAEEPFVGNDTDAKSDRFKTLAQNEYEQPPFQERYSRGYKTPTRHIEQSYLDCDPDVFEPVPEHSGVTPLISMCHIAFDRHRPLALLPDLLWHYICKGVATHINLHPEELRDIFVSHQGKKELSVQRDHFVLGGKNDWPGVFREFREQIGKNVKPEGQAVIGERFSTTTETMFDVSCILLMESVQAYFDFKCYTMCGIPSITLLGKQEDWSQLLESSRKILELFDSMPDKLNLKWWKQGLFPVLENLIACYQKPKDGKYKDWMARIYKYNREFGSGAVNHVTGWVNVFFPFLSNLQTNELAKIPLAASDDIDRGNRNELDDFPMSLSRAPFTWVYFANELPMTMIGGPCCVTRQQQDDATAAPKGALHSQFGWAVAHKPDPKKSG